MNFRSVGDKNNDPKKICMNILLTELKMTIFWLEPKRTYMPGADLAWPESAPVLRTSENSASKHEFKKSFYSVNPQSYSVLKTPLKKKNPSEWMWLPCVLGSPHSRPPG